MQEALVTQNTKVENLKDYDIIMCLNWILKTQILQYL